MHWRKSLTSNKPVKTWQRTLCCLLFLGLSACSDQVELYVDLTELQANVMVTELASKNIESYKTSHKKGISVSVKRHDFPSAIRTLSAIGLPSQARSSLGEVFRKEGMVSTPLEERARYIHALSQELETTLTQIEGVALARVHVVLAERLAPGQPVMPASAAVFIKHSSQVDPDVLSPRVQKMVASSIPGMGALAQTISVVFVPAAPTIDATPSVHWGPFSFTNNQIRLWRQVLFGLLVTTAVAAMVIFAHWKRRQYQFEHRNI
ncbi:type III secretion system inner membrane ring lipoprotein SctJ [Pseudomonas yamanorum]|uniref:type III secretion system inner membrane ring lipoprotein SctJ n=1 Tax=Pseudomonas yamanorum TaxID=515393 RepID=UPI00087D4B88|nr:type III secretion inner membrane ring lipoprotein SctJ [Pseudomonas yamanorum]SDT99687.1 type III secretion protein J [Pseudomonas yamanorum]